MKKLWLIVILILLLLGFGLYRLLPSFRKSATPQSFTSASVTSTPELKFALPIKNYFQNQTKKTFGQYITPQNSPVQPERFKGYHTGVDIEINPDDANAEVDVYAILNSKLVYKNWVSGYGGVAIISFSDNGQNYTALYGHLNINSVSKSVGETLTKGEKVGELGQGYTSQTDGERKHLHFSIYKGTSIQLKGYVQSESELSAWVDPNTIINEKNN